MTITIEWEKEQVASWTPGWLLRHHYAIGGSLAPTFKFDFSSCID